MGMHEVPADEAIKRIAEELKKMKNIKYPYPVPIKAGAYAERPPIQDDFWYIRCAAILRKLYLKGPLGTSRLRTMFGGKRRRGHKPPKFRKAGGKFIRTMLQQLEAEGLVKTVKGKGRIVTPKGQSFLDKIASSIKGGK
ncbi:MAG: 30S ribosomal protein S19e [Candidatus Micrarchaeota archaeon]|nr:30S ribosomal protein S19e [Candidatus Micrarchaeota archaeon]